MDMENGHSNISYSSYKDYENLSVNDFAESKQKIWDMVKEKFHVTHKIITDIELSEFTKIYISHFASREEDNLERGNHFYTTYHIVDPCSNIRWDRKHTLYIDKENKIVILESSEDRYGSEITEEVLKEASAKEARWCGLDDRLVNRTDKWLKKYDEWLGITQ